MLLIAGLLLAFVWMGLTVGRFDRKSRVRLAGVIAALCLGALARMLA
jgi:hypothetical protein